MKRVAGCLVASSLIAMAVWACGDEQDEQDDRAAEASEAAEHASLAAGSGTADPPLDARVAIDDVTMVIDVNGEPGPGSDADAGSGSDAMPCMGSGCDAGVDGSGAPDDGSGAPDDGSGTGTDDPGRDDARRGRETSSADRTSFYACAAGGASSGFEVGVPIGLALLFAVHRRRRWRRA